MGWLLHALQLHHGTSTILYAFGICCMFAAATRSGKGAQAVLLTSVVAADNVLHPAFYILLEGAMTAVVSLLFSIEPRKTSRPAWSLLEARLAVPAFATAVALTIFVG